MGGADILNEAWSEVFGESEDFATLAAAEAEALTPKLAAAKEAEAAYFALGCYWGAEAVFRCMPGVLGTRVGFMGGKKDSPTYERVGDHVETVEVLFDGSPETYTSLLTAAARTVDVVDFGSRYNRAVFPQGPGQLRMATAAGYRDLPVRPQGKGFFEAKVSHQAWSRPRCGRDAAAPNVALLGKGLKRVKDYRHYNQDCPKCLEKRIA